MPSWRCADRAQSRVAVRLAIGTSNRLVEFTFGAHVMQHLGSRGVTAVIAVVVAVSSVSLGLVEGRGARQSPPSQRGKTAGEAFKNIQVFTDLPESQLNDTMFFMKASLGVSCTHCHVDFENFEKDDKPAKHVARDMIRMVRALNDRNFGGQNVITCNTCHRGQVRPSAPLSFAPIVGPRPAAKPADTVPSPALPTVDHFRSLCRGDRRQCRAGPGGDLGHEGSAVIL
jgi:hypothetical protein